MAELIGLAAIIEGVREEMMRDESVFILGEDVNSGLFGFGEEFINAVGPNRVLDTPISESAFMGAAVGAAAAGMRPIVYSLSSFVWVAMDQIVSQAAKMHYMFGGQAKLPIVYIFYEIYGSRIAAHHSDRPHSMYANVPGLKIVLPSTPADAKGLVKTAIRENDPVIFFQDITVMYLSKGEVPEGDITIPFGVGSVKRQGSDVTIVSIGGMLNYALAAAQDLEKEGISVEVVDPRTLVPLDKGIILESVAKTGRLVVVDNAPRRCSAASEIAAMVAHEGFWDLKSPIVRVASENVVIPFTPVLEDLVYPTKEKIIKGVKDTLD